MFLSFFFILSLFAAGIDSIDDGCIYCGYQKHDTVDVPVTQFSRRSSVSVRFLLRNHQECSRVIIPSVRCHFMHSTTEVKFLHDTVTDDDISEWFAKEKLRLARKTPILRNLTCIVDALRDDRPLVIAFVGQSLFEMTDQLFAQVKDDWSLFLFFIVDSGIPDADSYLSKGFKVGHIDPNSIIFRQYMTGEVIFGSFYTMNVDKLLAMLGFMQLSAKVFLNPDELFNYRSRITVAKPTLVFVFMMYHHNLAHDLHMMNETVHLLRAKGLNLDFFLFNIDRHLRDISHSPEADFIVSFSHFLFAFNHESATFELPTIGPSDFVETLKRHTQGWKMKELTLLSQLSDAWQLDINHPISSLTRGHLSCNITAAPKKVIERAPLSSNVISENKILKFDSAKKERKPRKIPEMTEDAWRAMLHSTSATDRPYDQRHPQHAKSFLRQVKVTLVVFTRTSGCKHCADSHRYFQELYESILSGSLAEEQGDDAEISMFLIDCNKNFDFCLSNVGSYGFPSLMAVRHLPVKDLHHCIPKGSALPSHSRFFYHGLIETEELISWLSKQILSPSLTHKLPLSDSPVPLQPHHRRPDAQLLVHVLPAWSKKYPRSPVRKLHPFCLSCMRFVCEQLHGLVPCVVRSEAKEEEEEAGTEVQANFVVTKIVLQRADGVRAVVMQMATPLADTMDRHGPLHNFHQAHRYDFSPTTLCEDNHSRCSELLIRFTKDHARLPVTALSEEMLHQEASLFPDGFHLLVALVHSSNLTTENASFANMLEKLAKVLYNQIVVASLDVDHHGYWGTRFVPADYGSEHSFSEVLPPMYHYPRFAIISRLNHATAAFYPSPKIGFKAEYSLDELLRFVTQFLKDPKKWMQATEQF